MSEAELLTQFADVIIILTILNVFGEFNTSMEYTLCPKVDLYSYNEFFFFISIVSIQCGENALSFNSYLLPHFDKTAIIIHINQRPSIQNVHNIHLSSVCLPTCLPSSVAECIRVSFVWCETSLVYR